MQIIPAKNDWANAFSEIGKGASQGYRNRSDEEAIREAITSLDANASPREIINALIGVKTYNPEAKQTVIKNFMGAAEFEEAQIKEKSVRENFTKTHALEEKKLKFLSDQAVAKVKSEEAKTENIKSKGVLDKLKAESQVSMNSEKIKLKKYEIEQKNNQLEKNRQLKETQFEKNLSFQQKKQLNSQKSTELRQNLEQAKLDQRSIEHAQKIELENLKLAEKFGNEKVKNELAEKIQSLQELKESNRAYESSLDRDIKQNEFQKTHEFKERELTESQRKNSAYEQLKEKEFDNKVRMSELSNQLAQLKFQEDLIDNEEKRLIEKQLLNQKESQFDKMYELNKLKEENRIKEKGILQEAKLKEKKDEKFKIVNAALSTIEEMRKIRARNNLGRGSSITKNFSDQALADYGEYEQLGKSLIQVSTPIMIRNQKEFEKFSTIADPTTANKEAEGELKGLEKILLDRISEIDVDETEENAPTKKPLSAFKRG